MHFSGEPPSIHSRMLMGDIAWRIFAEGEIDSRSGEELEQFLLSNDVPSASTMCIHSDGGSLSGGMSLGRVIREHLLRVHVGRRGEQRNGYFETLPGHCMSAGAIAFLGGDFRFVGSENKFGVHRFTLPDNDSDNVGSTQVMAAAVIEYIRSMEVDTDLFTLASETKANDIFVVPEETLLRLNVVNNGRKKPSWTIESVSGALYLKGEQHTVFGMNKFLVVFPAQGDVYLHIIFDAGVNTKDVMDMQIDRLVLDGQHVEMHELRMSRENDEGRINALYTLTPELIERIAKATAVGMAFQWTAEAPIFFGFDSMPFEDGAAKLHDMLSVYRRNGA